MDEKTKQRIEEIQERLEDYQNHKDDFKDFYYRNPDEIPAIREMYEHAPEDIEFLLNELRRLRVLTTLRHSPSRISEK